MERLAFICEDWSAVEAATLKLVTRMIMPDFRGVDKDCWHLRGRGWRWLILKCTYPELTINEEYEFCFWAKIDYYSGRGTKCYIDVYEENDWEGRHVYDIIPNSPSAVAQAGEWILYKIRYKAVYGMKLVIQFISFEANIAIMPAVPEDETDVCVTAIRQKDTHTPFVIDNEIPFREYASLEQRMVKFYYDQLAPFYPCKDIPEVSQREYYDFVEGIYSRLFTAPEGFFTKLYEDDAHPNRFNNSEYGKPDLKRHMKSDMAKIEELFELLYDLCRSGEVMEGGLRISYKISNKQQKLISYMGLTVSEDLLWHERYKNISTAMKYLAGKDYALWSLMFCWFEDSYPYLEKTYAKFYDEEQYERLTGWLKENGYNMFIRSGSGVTMDYYKSINDKGEQLGYAIHGDKAHYGFTFEFRAEPRVMQHCELRIIQFGEMLLRFEELSENTRQLIMLRTKRCDGCRYCIQTDKTGKRPFAAINIGEGISFCPYYPGFNYVFERLLKSEVDCIIDFLVDMEKLVTNK